MVGEVTERDSGKDIKYLVTGTSYYLTCLLLSASHLGEIHDVEKKGKMERRKILNNGKEWNDESPCVQKKTFSSRNTSEI